MAILFVVAEEDEDVFPATRNLTSLTKKGFDAKLLQVPGGNASDGTAMCMWEAVVAGSSFAASQAQQTEIKSRPGKEGLLQDICLCLFPLTPIPK